MPAEGGDGECPRHRVALRAPPVLSRTHVPSAKGGAGQEGLTRPGVPDTVTRPWRSAGEPPPRGPHAARLELDQHPHADLCWAWRLPPPPLGWWAASVLPVQLTGTMPPSACVSQQGAGVGGGKPRG